MARIPKRFQEDTWQTFTAWCQERGLQAVPAHHWTLAAYARALEDQEKPAEIRKIMIAIAKVHGEKSRNRPDRHPLIERTLKVISTREQSKEQHSKLFDEDLTKEAKPKKAAKPKAAAKKKAAAKPKTGRAMSSEPKLVSRRRMSK